MNLKNQPWHCQTDLKNQITNWSGSDTEDMWYYNIKEHKRKMDRLGWEISSIQYKHNSNGFRTDEFDNRESAIAFGCSFTYGTGLCEKDVWPVILSDKIGKYVWNLGIGGAALDTVYRICKYYIDNLNAQDVFLLSPPNNRYEYYNMSLGIIDTMMPHMIEHFGEVAKGYVMDEMIELNYHKNIEAIQHYCYLKNVNFYELSSDNIKCTPGLSFPGYARDLLHPGRIYQEEVANSFYNMVK